MKKELDEVLGIVFHNPTEFKNHSGQVFIGYKNPYLAVPTHNGVRIGSDVHETFQDFPEDSWLYIEEEEVAGWSERHVVGYIEKTKLHPQTPLILQLKSLDSLLDDACAAGNAGILYRDCDNDTSLYVLLWWEH